MRTSKREMRSLATVFAALALVLAACAPAAQPGPAAAPAKPAAPAQPAAAPAPSPAAQPATTPAEGSAGSASLTEAERQEVEAFYRGKTIRLLVGFAPGAGYDLFARMTAKPLGKYIPGNPAVVVENMVGAASAVVANHVYNAAPKDGTVIGTFDPALSLVQAVGGGGGGLQFDPARYPWLGSPNSSTNMCMVRSDTGVDSMEKLLASPREIVFGATSMGNSTSAAVSVMQHFLGAKVRIVTGYDGVAKIKLAVESGEADGLCGTWETIKVSNAEWLSANPPFARVIVKSKPQPDGDLQDVPLMSQFLQTEEGRQIFAMAMAPQTIGFHYATAPGTPPARLKALRIAVLQAWNDPEFQADAAKSQALPFPQDYQTVERLVNEVISSPPDTLKRAKDILGIQ